MDNLNIDLASLEVALAETNGLPILLDLWAPWCAPCLAQAPVLERLAGESAGHLRVAKLDVDANPDANRRFSVRGIPLLILFKGGKEVSRRTGLQNRDQLRKWMEDEGLDLGLASEEYLLKEPLRLGGAFHNDPELRDFLLNRWYATADKGGVRTSRFPYWTDGHGTVSAALVKSNEDGMFEQVSGLPAALGIVLDFVKITQRTELEQLAEVLPAGADLRGAPLRFVRHWLSDKEWNWPELIGPDANQLRLEWLEIADTLLRREAVPEVKWNRLAENAIALESDDPMLTAQSHFARLIKRLSPLPASSDGAWSVLLAVGTFLSHARGMYANSFTAADLSFEAVRMNWYKSNCPNPEGLSKEQMDELHRRFHDENAALVSSAEPKLRAFYQNMDELMQPWHERLRSHLIQALRDALARAR